MAGLILDKYHKYLDNGTISAMDNKPTG